MTKRKQLPWNDVIRQAVKASGLSLYAVSRDSGVGIGPVQRFMAGEHGLTVNSAEKIGRLVGLELRPVEPARRKGGA